MGAPPKARILLLRTLEENNGRISDDYGKALDKLFELLKVQKSCTKGAFSQLISVVKNKELVDLLKDGNKCLAIEITPKGIADLDNNRHLLASRQITEGVPEKKPDVPVTEAEVDSFKKINSELGKIQEQLVKQQSDSQSLVAENFRLEGEIAKARVESERLRQDLAREQARCLKLVEEVKSLRAKIDGQKSHQTISLRPADLKPEWRETARKALEQGWVIDFTSGGHLRWTPPDGKRPVVSANTPGDHRSVRNTISELVRSGLII